jgi:hypothetical protein
LTGQTPDEAYHQTVPRPFPGHAPETALAIPLAA